MEWRLLLKTSNGTEASIIKGRLEEAGILAEVLNKQDSMYLLALPGMYEVYVLSHQLDAAKILLQNSES